jgi:hypothetical protein
MATNKKLSALISSQLPQYLADEGPNLIAFMKAYYEWMETTGQVADASKNLLAYQDIDDTDLDQFYEYFRREVLCQFPKDFEADKRLVAKRIKDLYKAKGTKLSFNLLFRILFNEDLDFLNPADNILRASDGRWLKENIIRLGSPFVGNIELIVGETVTGQTSGATGRVQEAVTVIESGIEVKQLRISNVVGTFLDLEQVVSQSGKSGFILNTIGPLQGVSFPDSRFNRGGSGHQQGDRVSFTSVQGSGATGTVVSTDESVVVFSITDGGSGYRVNNTIVTVSGGTGVGGSVTVQSISNTESIFAYTDSIRALANTKIGFGPTYGISANTDTFRASANLEASNANTPLGTALGTTLLTVGTINSISFTTGNYNVNLPIVSTIDTDIAILELGDGAGGKKGKNAVITPSFVPGSIAAVQVDNNGRQYSANFPISVNNLSRSGTTPASGDPIISGIVEDPGRYTDTKGFLSWDKRIRDNFYYQEYSYVLRSSKSVKSYRDTVHGVVHPAGTKMFGQVDLTSELDLSINFDVETVINTDLIGVGEGVQSITSTLTFGTHQLDRNLTANSVLSTTTLGPLGVGRPLDLTSTTTTAAVPNVNVLFVVGPDGIPSTLTFSGANSSLSAVISDVTIASAETLQTNNIVLLPGNGFLSISNNNTITEYLGQPITNYLDTQVIIVGTPFSVIGDGTTFGTILAGGATIEIQDLDPGLAGNTTYIVNTVFSNTSLTINTAFVGGNLANGIFRYTYSNI